MLLSLRKNRLASLFKEVRVFKVQIFQDFSGKQGGRPIFIQCRCPVGPVRHLDVPGQKLGNENSAQSFF